MCGQEADGHSPLPVCWCTLTGITASWGLYPRPYPNLSPSLSVCFCPSETSSSHHVCSLWMSVEASPPSCGRASPALTLPPSSIGLSVSPSRVSPLCIFLCGFSSSLVCLFVPLSLSVGREALESENPGLVFQLCLILGQVILPWGLFLHSKTRIL